MKKVEAIMVPFRGAYQGVERRTEKRIRNRVVLGLERWVRGALEEMESLEDRICGTAREQ